MATKQYTIRVVSYVTITAEEGLDINDVAMHVDVPEYTEDDTSPVLELNETEIIEKTIITEVSI